jgi:hypothetical protein
MIQSFVESAMTSESGNPVSVFRQGPLSRPVIIRSATGFNSRVVTTSSIPSRVRNSAGESAHNAPNNIPLNKINGTPTKRGSDSALIPTSVAPIVPASSCPSAPIFQ